MYSAAVFDMDGLLLDSERPIRDAWREVVREVGLEIDDAVYLQVVGRQEADVREILGEALRGRMSFDEACERVRAQVSGNQIANGYRVKPGAVDLLSLLRARGVPCCVASSTRLAEVERRLTDADLLKFFEVIAGGDEVARAKPSPDLFS